MNTLSQKFFADIVKPEVEEFCKPFECSDMQTVLELWDTYVSNCKREFYQRYQDNRNAFLASKIILEICEIAGKEPIEHWKIAKSDSKAEVIFYQMLKDGGLEFKFQVEIGLFRVDFLFEFDCVPHLIIELDGPLHGYTKDQDERRDNVLRSKGYEVLRIPIWVVAIGKERVVNKIKEMVDGWEKFKP